MVGSIVLAVFACAPSAASRPEGRLVQRHTGGASSLRRVGALALLARRLRVWMLPLVTLVVYLGVNWWASWYPGAEPGGGGYIAQRIFSAKNERHGVLAALWFNIAHYALRPWPWIIVALCSLVLYHGRRRESGDRHVDPAFGYVQVMNDSCPAGSAACCSPPSRRPTCRTISTQMNWGSSYLVNDFYRRFIKHGRDRAHYVFASRPRDALIVVLSLVVTYYMSRITSGWELVLDARRGTGLVYILRWYWWRVNAWSEIAAMSAALVVSLGLRWSGTFDPARPSASRKRSSRRWASRPSRGSVRHSRPRRSPRRSCSTSTAACARPGRVGRRSRRAQGEP